MGNLCIKRPQIYASTEDLNDQSSHNGSSVGDEVLDIKADNFSENDRGRIESLNLSYLDLWALGLTTAVGGHFFSWSAGLSAGFGSHIIALGLWIGAYYCLVLCISELSSALPFAGGVYGLARVTLGIYPGFLVAVLDTYKPILNAASAAYAVGSMLTVITDTNIELQFLFWALFYVYCLAVNGYGGLPFWYINKLSAIISMLLLGIYIFGTIKDADFNAYAPLPNESGNEEWFHGGIYKFMQILPSPTRFFLGIQSTNLACGLIRDPKTNIAKASIGSISTVIITSIAVTFLACSVAPGTFKLTSTGSPLNPGFAQMFDILPKRALILSVPPILFYGNTYVFFFGQQLSSMGRSGLLNSLFAIEMPVRNTPIVSHLFGAAVGYAVCVAQYYYVDVKAELNNMKVLASMFTYIAILSSFIIFRLRFPTIKREFVSPLGIPGALFCMFISTLCVISVVGFQPDQDALIAFVCLLAVISVYYYFVVRHRQVFSEEEKKVMFTAYLVKGNMAKARRIHRTAKKNKPGIHQQHSLDDIPKRSLDRRIKRMDDTRSSTKESDNSISMSVNPRESVADTPINSVRHHNNSYHSYNNNNNRGAGIVGQPSMSVNECNDNSQNDVSAPNSPDVPPHGEGAEHDSKMANDEESLAKMV